MASGTDDDALSWDGDDDPTLDAGTPRPRTTPASADPAAAPAAPVLPEGFTAVGKGAESFAPAHDAAATGSTGASDAADDSGKDLADSGTADADTVDGDDAVAAAPLGNAALIAVGAFVGVYALYIIGWIIGGRRLGGYAQFLVAPVGYQVSLWLAVAAPALWFAAVWVLTRRSRAWVRILWLVAGVLLLVPWPFIMVGAVGA